MMSGIATCCVRRTYLIGGHREGVDVTLLRGVAVHEAELRWVQQLRGHVPDHPGLGCRGTAWFHDGRICDDARDPEVPEASIALFGDQDVPLDTKGIGTYLNPKIPFITHRIDITMYYT